MLNILIVEDEYITIRALRQALTDMNYQIAGEAMSADEAIEVLKTETVDAAILDINIRGEQDGIWLGHQINQHYQIPFIYLTAYSDPGTVKRAAAAKPSGYLVKPFQRNDIFAALEIAITNFNAKQSAETISKQTPTEAENHQHNGSSNTIFIKAEKKYVRLPIPDVVAAEAQKNYVKIYLQNAQHLIRSTLKDFIRLLPDSEFIQCHRSFYIRHQSIESVSSNQVIIGSNNFPLGQKYRHDLMEKLRLMN